jgi:hypothetical protein
MMLTGALLAVLHLVFIVSAPPLLPAMLAMAVLYSGVACTAWPTVPLMALARDTGTAFGIMHSARAFGLTVVPYAIGAILDAGTPPPSQPGEIPQPTPAAFAHASALLLFVAALGAAAAAALMAVDRAASGGVLSASPRARAALLAAAVAAAEDEPGCAAADDGASFEMDDADDVALVDNDGAV